MSSSWYTRAFSVLGLPGLRWIYPTTKRVLAFFHDAAAFSAQAQAAQDDAMWYRSDACQHLAAMVERQGLKDRFQGRRLFLIGNGPSLGKMDLRPLKDEVTLGTNRIYLLFDQIDWRPTLYTCCNKYVIEQSRAEIGDIPSLKFLSTRAQGVIAADEQTAFVRSQFAHRIPDGFSRDILYGWNEGSTITYASLQLAYFLGFSEVVLIGVDHSYSASRLGSAHQVVRTGKADADHFAPNYFGPTTRWQLPDLAGSEYSYRVARRVYESSGRRIVDATVGGQLTIFPKVDYTQLF